MFIFSVFVSMISDLAGHYCLMMFDGSLPIERPVFLSYRGQWRAGRGAGGQLPPCD